MLRFSAHYFLLFMVLICVWPYMPAFLRARGFSEAEVGYLQGMRMVAGVGGPLLVAWLSDRLGRRRMLISACLVGFAVLVVPLNWTQRFLVAAPLMAGLGFVLRATVPLSDALAAGELEDPGHQYGRVRVCGSLGAVFALFAIRIFGLVDEHSSTSMMRAMLVAAALSLVAVQFLPERRQAEAESRAARAAGVDFDIGFWLFLGAAALQQLGMSSYYAFFTIYLHDELGMQQAAWVWAPAALAEMPVLFWSGWVIRRFRLVPLMVAAMAAVSVRLAVYALAPTPWAVLPAQLLHALAFGVFHISCIEFIRRRVPERRRAVAMSFYMSLTIALPLLVGSSIGGLVIERFGYSVLYGAYAAAPLAGMAVLGAGRRLIDTSPREQIG